MKTPDVVSWPEKVKKKKKNKANQGYCRVNYRFLHNIVQCFCLLASKALDEHHRKKSWTVLFVFYLHSMLLEWVWYRFKRMQKRLQTDLGGGKGIVGRFIVLVIMIIELELIEHSSCLNLHISKLLIIWKSYDKMQFYFLIAAECLISFVSRPVPLFFSADSKQFIFGIAWNSPQTPANTGMLRHDGEGSLTHNHNFLWCCDKQLSKDHFISIQSYWNLQNYQTGGLECSWRPPRFSIPFFIPNKQSLQVIYNMHFWA